MLIAAYRLLQLNENYSIVILCLGAMVLISSYGLWRGLKWAWIFTVLVSVLGILGGVYMTLTKSLTYIYALPVNLALVYYLIKPTVREFFEGGSLEAAGLIPYIVTIVFTAFLASLGAATVLLILGCQGSSAIVSSVTAAAVAVVTSRIRRKCKR
ncbi:hypothetical protein DRN52_07070 [Thermococci archaeon]|nr:MAG: hypothetical protein DRN52_07070 [Thermococci archaeon]